MNDRGRLLIGVFLIAVVVISFNFSVDYRVSDPQTTGFIDKMSLIPDGSVVAVQLVSLYDESVEIEPAFTALLWYLAQRNMKVVFIPLLPESELVLEKSVEKVRDALSDRDSFPEIIPIDRVVDAEGLLSWSRCNFTPGSLFAMRHFALDYLGCHTTKKSPLYGLQAVVVVGSTVFDGMPAPMLYALFGQKSQLQIPLFVLASAQKRPILTPFVKTGQITAMITGNRNSLAFAAKVGLPIDFSRQAMAVTALILSVVIILCGMIITILFRKRR